MKTIRDSFELQEAARISSELIAEAAVAAPANPDSNWPKVTLAETTPVVSKTEKGGAPTTAVPSISSKVSAPPSVYREEQLEKTMAAMCKRAGFIGAVIADNSGSPLAAHNSPVNDQIMATFTSILGTALEKAGNLLDEHKANHITLDINHTEKAALRLFHIDGRPYFLMIICPQEVDEKTEVELSIVQLAAVLE